MPTLNIIPPNTKIKGKGTTGYNPYYFKDLYMNNPKLYVGIGIIILVGLFFYFKKKK